MTVEVRIPKLGMSMTEGVLAEWLVADGDSVQEGSPIYVLETDKAGEEIESPASGVLRVIAQTGETYEVGTLIAQIE